MPRPLTRQGGQYRRRREEFAAQTGYSGPFLIPADETQSMVRELRSRGFTNKRIAYAAGIPTSHASELFVANGPRTIHVKTAMAVKAAYDKLIEQGADPLYVDSTEARHLLCTLRSAGWKIDHLARESKVPPRTLKGIMDDRSRDRATRDNVERVMGLRRLVGQPLPNPYYVEASEAKEALQRATDAGYLRRQIAEATGFSEAYIINMLSANFKYKTIRRPTHEAILNGVEKMMAETDPEGLTSTKRVRAAVDQAFADGYTFEAMQRYATQALVFSARKRDHIKIANERRLLYALEDMRYQERPTRVIDDERFNELCKALVHVRRLGYSWERIAKTSGVSSSTVADIAVRKRHVFSNIADAIFEGVDIILEYHEHQRRKWPVSNLRDALRMAGVNINYLRERGIQVGSGQTMRTDTAERAAKALELHPSEIWPDW